MATFIAAGIILAYEILAEKLHITIQQTSYLTGVQVNARSILQAETTNLWAFNLA